MIEKTLKIRKKTSGGNSVEDDLNDHFSVLNELSSRLEEYYTIPTITAGHDWEFQE